MSFGIIIFAAKVRKVIKKNKKSKDYLWHSIKLNTFAVISGTSFNIYCLSHMQSYRRNNVINTKRISIITKLIQDQNSYE